MVAKEATNVNAIAGHFEVSRQAISLHLKILAECGLLEIRQQGRERICEAKLENLAEVNQWVSQYRKFWTQKLDALENYLDNIFNTETDEKSGENIGGK